MRVAIVSYGFGEYCVQQANGLSAHANVLLMLPRDEAEPFDAQLAPSVRREFFVKPRLRQPARQLLLAARIVRQLRRFDPDVIHVQHGHMWFNLALPWLRSIPLVITIHDPRHHVGDRASRKTPQALMDFGFRRADRVIVHGESLRRQVVEQLRISGQRVHVIPHVALGSDERPSPPASDRRQILFFGRIWQYKGLEYLIRAQPMIGAAFPDAQIVIAGEGDDFEPYRRLMADKDRFIVHNRFVSVGERDELFRQATIVALPYIAATQSGVIPLAYAHAKPVVATATGALGEAVESGKTGLLVPPSDADAIAQAIIQLLGDPARARAMGEAGRRKLDAECAPHVVARQTLDVYRTAIRDREGQKRSTTETTANSSMSKACT
jgi:glycosyltransferase involved in cell wall biosynthesis